MAKVHSGEETLPKASSLSRVHERSRQTTNRRRTDLRTTLLSQIRLSQSHVRVKKHRISRLK